MSVHYAGTRFLSRPGNMSYVMSIPIPWKLHVTTSDASVKLSCLLLTISSTFKVSIHEVLVFIDLSFFIAPCR